MRINVGNTGSVQAASVQPGSVPSNPHHVSRAYGLQAPGETRRGPRLSGSDQEPPQPAQPDGIRRLVGGVVAGGVSFDSGGGAAQRSDTLAMYRHPADKNAAATAVNVGRSLDVRG